MNRVLILSCSTGGGHDSCAKAIEEYFNGRGCYCEIRDSLNFISDKFSALISHGHSFIYRHIPGLFDIGWTGCENHHRLFRDGSVISRILSLGNNGIEEYVSRGKFDTVICTHLFPALMLTGLIKDGRLKDVRTAFVATDHTWYPGTMYADRLDYYFVADEEQVGVYEGLGIPVEKIRVSGIPIKRIFFGGGKESARSILDIPEDAVHLMIMCGSMGAGPVEKILKGMCGKLSENTRVSVLCGTNRKLSGNLLRKYGDDPGIRIEGGFIDYVCSYYDASDIFMTKPGGISTTEAAARGLPMIFMDTVGGCEKYNMDFFRKRGMAVSASTPEGLAEEALKLLNSPETLAGMRSRLEDYSQPDGAAGIYEILK